MCVKEEGKMARISKHNDFVRRIIRHLSGETSREERVWLEEWIHSDPEHKDLYEEYKKVWIKAEIAKDQISIDVDQEWHKLEAKIETTEKIEKIKPVRQPVVFSLYRVAAVLIIALLTTFVAIQVNRSLKYHKVVTKLETKEILLPDGTSVSLNAYSTFKYPKKFREDTRKVILSGEAFFVVKPDKARLFSIQAEEIQINVLGTSFNVNAYKQNETIEVIVATGKVSLSSTADTKNKIIIGAGSTGLYFQSEEKLTTKQNENINYLAWKTKILKFVNQRLPDVVQTINKVYHTNLVITNPAVLDCRITTTFDNQSVEAILNVLKQTLDLEIKESEGTIEISGEGC